MHDELETLIVTYVCPKCNKENVKRLVYSTNPDAGYGHESSCKFTYCDATHTMHYKVKKKNKKLVMKLETFICDGITIDEVDITHD